jgi:hypothetical protein
MYPSPPAGRVPAVLLYHSAKVRQVIYCYVAHPTVGETVHTQAISTARLLWVNLFTRSSQVES